ncbi:hypothetical protein G7Y89_g11156 [Cudoniella acicularis]|uniref:Histone-lysine N-methyltransferase, H3 lysine-79 specific n=1 Tax=Cudoniella acicularis TaxID=354080 RepID=A0A8H4VYA4_9HELO|nr:hypothetical protein G7Y89_g11156 [Cudoniella acicularis]
MGPSRKRARPNPPTAASTNVTDQADLLPTKTPQSTITQPASNVLEHPGHASNNEVESGASTPLKKPVGSNQKQVKPKGSWYGTWPRKSTASTQIARETILADMPKNTPPSVDLSQFESKRVPPSSTPSRPPSMYLGKSKETLDISMGGTLEGEGSLSKDRNAITTPSTTNEFTTAPQGLATPHQAITTPPETVEETSTELETQPPIEPPPPQRPATSSGWLGGWLSRPAPQNQDVTEDVMQTQEPPNTSEQLEQMQVLPPESEEPPAQLLNEDKATPVVKTTSSSWFGLWSTAAPSTTPEVPETQIPVKTTNDGEDTVMEDAPAPKPVPEQTSGSSSWAFWSTETTKKTSAEPAASQGTGQVAVTGEPSQNNPEPARVATVKSVNKGKSSKRGRPQSVEIDEASRQMAQQESTTGTPLQSTPSAKKSPPNLIIPSVKQTYRLVENPSILQQIARLLLHGEQKPVKHVFLVKDPPKIKNALAIGIHGLFPAPLLRTVIGQPTGTSIRFANHGAAAIRRWADSHGCADCEIEKVALEGEGKIGDRVDNLWKLLLNWIDHVRKADFILVSCHSQGVPVAIMLVAKLIEFGVVASGKIGVCAMAGVSLGPFPDYKSRLFSGSAGELFEFADPESVVSKRYEDSLRVAMKYGVKVTYCGSIDDQLVSLESSTFSPASHPYIYRAVFVDGRIHAPDFLSHLVGFALKLRNLGVADHGLIRELSTPLAGSLYTGEGHSRLYDEGKVYDFAIEFALETTSVGEVPLGLKKYEIPNNANPYVLPWIMRGLLEEDFVKTELSSETSELLKQFNDWKPATKPQEFQKELRRLLLAAQKMTLSPDLSVVASHEAEVESESQETFVQANIRYPYATFIFPLNLLLHTLFNFSIALNMNINFGKKKSMIQVRKPTIRVEKGQAALKPAPLPSKLASSKRQESPRYQDSPVRSSPSASNPRSSPATTPSVERDVPSSRHLTVKRKAARQISPSTHVVWDNDDDEDSDGDDGNKSSSELTRHKRQRTEEQAVDLNRQLRSRKAFSGEDGGRFEMIHAADIAQSAKGSKLPAGATVKDVTVELKYPSASQRERYVTMSDSTSKANREPFMEPNQGLIRMIEKAKNLMKTPITKEQLNDFQNAVEKWNLAIEELAKNGSLAKNLDNKHHLPFDQVCLMLRQVYDRAVSPNVDNLRKYQNGSDNVYGELLPPLVSKMLKKTELRSNQIFVDLGSGVGSVVLQAALEFGARSWGCEMMENACALAADQKREFASRCRLWGIETGKVTLERGDFLENDRIKATIKRADVILVNNQAFTSDLNQRLTDLFLDVKEGCKIVSLKSFVPSGHQITSRNLHNPVNVFAVTEGQYYARDVSWTDAGGSYFVATKDSGRVERFMSKHSL